MQAVPTNTFELEKFNSSNAKAVAKLPTALPLLNDAQNIPLHLPLLFVEEDAVSSDPCATHNRPAPTPRRTDVESWYAWAEEV
jgi:hypothetical protein